MAGSSGTTISDESSTAGDVVPVPTETLDGRSARRVRNREAVIRSLIELIEGGDLDPSIDKIAERAAVSARSIFRYFTDLPDLARTAIETQLAEIYDLGHISGIGKGSFAERVEKLLESRMRVVQHAWRMARVAEAKSVQMSELEEGLALGARLMREQVRRNFAAELEPLDEPTSEALVNALATSLDQQSYDAQRRYLERTDEQIAASWRMLLHRALG